MHTQPKSGLTLRASCEACLVLGSEAAMRSPPSVKKSSPTWGSMGLNQLLSCVEACRAVGARDPSQFRAAEPSGASAYLRWPSATVPYVHLETPGGCGRGLIPGRWPESRPNKPVTLHEIRDCTCLAIEPQNQRSPSLEIRLPVFLVTLGLPIRRHRVSMRPGRAAKR